MQKLKTSVIKNNCNPTWNEEMTLYVKDVKTPVHLVSSFVTEKKMSYPNKRKSVIKTYL